MFPYKPFDPVAFDRRSNFFGNGYANSGSSEAVGRKNSDEVFVLYSATGFGQGEVFSPL